jgi:CheY-like chemotaxis protein
MTGDALVGVLKLIEFGLPPRTKGKFYRANVTGNDLEALNTLNRQSDDLIFMDTQMPEMADYVSKPIQVKELEAALERAGIKEQTSNS